MGYGTVVRPYIIMEITSFDLNQIEQDKISENKFNEYYNFVSNFSRKYTKGFYFPSTDNDSLSTIYLYRVNMLWNTLILKWTQKRVENVHEILVIIGISK